MQDCLALQREIVDLANKFGDVTVVQSSESWNPVAAVIIDSFELPANISTRGLAIRIPIPDLYGFAASAYCFILPNSIYESINDKLYLLPGSHLLDETCISRHRREFVDFRERRAWPETPITFFLNPPWHDEGFIHEELNSFIKRSLNFLAAPRITLKQDMSYCVKQWKKTGFWWWLCRLGEINLDLGNIKEARRALSMGAKLFPSQARFRELLELFL